MTKPLPFTAHERAQLQTFADVIRLLSKRNLDRFGLILGSQIRMLPLDSSDNQFSMARTSEAILTAADIIDDYSKDTKPWSASN